MGFSLIARVDLAYRSSCGDFAMVMKSVWKIRVQQDHPLLPLDPASSPRLLVRSVVLVRGYHYGEHRRISLS